MNNGNILLLLRKKDFYSDNLATYVKKIYKNVTIFYSSKINEKINKNFLKTKDGYYDYIYSFRSYLILKKADLKKAGIAAINFHPGPVNYRGFGPANFAIYKKDTKYGITAHLMKKKIDFGSVIDLQEFKISQNENINKLLQKTHIKLLKQAKQVISLIYKDKRNLEKMIIKNKKIKWSEDIYTFKKLNKLYEINLDNPKEDIIKKIKATLTPKHRPYIKVNNKKYFIN